ncbi:MAG: YgiQ family radical SAM protein [Methylobacter sp.]|nr:YgiQ family radical SAM protein [Methylobacter sp.]MDP2427096.1 YgiQ family radical SAM protein [Methylobacter sp.]MDP3055872.1 YgiQ family radical SAM protein [Methylobacter sp.]MDP3363452.1 YgiQ family radical SAM protein [Methylobacter sp.]MDZ4217945.1 YgiQ family radical SAM protein [Methylobacter sp.]
MSTALHTEPNLFSYRKYWAQRFGIAPVLPMGKTEMDELGWDACDVILVTGDAYIDHPSFGMALIGRLLEAQGFRVGIISQPDWTSAKDFGKLGRPNLFFGVTGGNMDSMVNRYTSDKKIRSNDAYTPDGAAGKRPDRAVNVYSHRCREAYKDVPIIIGGIEASLRRIAHYDYWSDKVRKSVLLDSKADLLVYGNAERQIVEIAHRLANGEAISELKGIRGTVHFVKQIPEGWAVKDSTDVDKPGVAMLPIDPYQEQPACDKKPEPNDSGEHIIQFDKALLRNQRSQTVIRLPAYEAVKDDPILYAHASRVMHGETNPGNARALIQLHGNRQVWINPPPIPLTTKEMDGVFDLPYSRVPHKAYGSANVPAFEMIQHSVNIMRGCFGGCTFCSITEHEGRIIQSRSEDSIIKEIEAIRDTSPAFTGHISDLGGPTANMYRLACKDPAIEAACRKPSCVYPGICPNLNTDHTPLIKLYRRARALPGIKKIFIASGLRYDLAVESPEYVKELVTHHVGGYLKIAPEHTEQSVLSKMMKPGMGTYDRFKEMFDQFSKEAGKEQYLIPYFIAAHPGTTDTDMLNLALWLKRNGFRADQVQAFLPSPMSIATAMYHSGKDTLHKVSRNVADIPIPKSVKQRRLHKAFLRYHDPKNWPLLREALKDMGRSDLIGNGKQHLIPSFQPKGTVETPDKIQRFKTKYTGLDKIRPEKSQPHLINKSKIKRKPK